MKLTTATSLIWALMAGAASAQSWVLDSSNSHLAYGSIKKDTVGEVNSFSALSGSVSTEGLAKVSIDLSSLETNIDIRNERMADFVFQGAGSADLSAQIDMNALNTLAVGDATAIYADVTLSLLGAEIPLEAELYVLRVSDARVMVSTNDMVFLSTADAGVDDGVSKLMEIAKLPGITRTVPVTLRLMFDHSDETAAMPTQAEEKEMTAMAGDAAAGRKVFNKCKACHKLEEGKRGPGPSLYKVIGATAGQVDGFKYSNAMASSGIVWTEDNLTAFLTAPKKFMQNNKMAFNGFKKPEDIANVLAYIAENGGS